MSLPSTLYKYEDLTTRTLQHLKEQVLYFGSPLKFNDPYDCALMPDIKVPSDEDIEAYRRQCLQKPTLNERQRHEFETFSRERLREILLRHGHSTIREWVDRFRATRGVTCFSECNDNLLMWAHYGGKYKGMCLEFSTVVESFSEISKIKKVRYVQSLPVLDVARLLKRDPDLDMVAELVCTKSMGWSYEREWRAIHSTVGTEYVYPAEALTGVYFGPDIENSAVEIVCLILAGQNENVRLWKGSRSSTEFRVTFEEFKYASHLQARLMALT